MARSSELGSRSFGDLAAGIRERVESPTVLLATALALGLALRLYDIGTQSFWLDEAGRAAIAGFPLAEIPSAVAVVELSPPLYHILLHGWTRLFGAGDVAVRLFSAVLVFPTVPLAWSIGDAVGGRRVGALTATLAATSPVAVYYGREAAMYALLLTLSLATLRAAIAALASPADVRMSPSHLRRYRALGLVAYMALGTLTLYTHYYAAFLLACVAGVGVVHATTRRSLHGLALWVGAHLVIALAFLPWMAVAGRQAALAASVPDWRGVQLDEALTRWSGTALANVAPAWDSALAVAFLLLAGGFGFSQLRGHRPSVWLVAAVALGPVLAAGLTSAVTHSFRERGLMVAIGGLWVLLAAGLAANPTERRRTRIARTALALIVGLGTVDGLTFDYARAKEQWRDAARIVSDAAGPSDPIFFVHYGAQVAFDRYFAGDQPRVGLPETFNWTDGYTGRYLVRPEDAARRVPPAVAGRGQAWAVLSHEQGRGAEHLLAALDRWGSRAEDTRLEGVRVVRFVARAGPA